jgi:hypothetical protein
LVPSTLIRSVSFLPFISGLYSYFPHIHLLSFNLFYLLCIFYSFLLFNFLIFVLSYPYSTHCISCLLPCF